VIDDLPRLPVRAAIYLLPDGSVQFGALFAELLPIARALGSDAPDSGTPTEIRRGEVSVGVPEIGGEAER
jgi:hypothetical protein